MMEYCRKLAIWNTPSYAKLAKHRLVLKTKKGYIVVTLALSQMIQINFFGQKLIEMILLDVGYLRDALIKMAMEELFLTEKQTKHIGFRGSFCVEKFHLE